MRTEILSVREALSLGQSLPWALIHTLSTVTLGKTPAGLEELPLEELLEARFFGEDEEVRVFRRDGALRGAVLVQEEGDAFLEETYRVENPRLGRQITVRRHLAADEDGETHVAATRLAGWEGGKDHDDPCAL